MTEQKHFSYEGHVEVKTPNMADAKITDVEFLVPVKLTVQHKNGSEQIVNGHVNWANRKAYFGSAELDETLGEKMFSYLSGKLSMEEDAFAAPQDVVEKAGEVHGNFEELYHQNVGACDE